MTNGLQMTGPTLGINSPNPNVLLVVQAVSFVLFAALAAQTWDLTMLLSDEIEYIWRGRFRFLQALYIGSQYGMLVVQVINQILSFYVEDRQPALSPLCLGIFIYKAIILQMGLALVEIILLVRVYALYNHSFHTKCMLFLIFLVATLLESTGNSIVIRSLASGPGCTPTRVDRQGIVIFGIGAGLCQFVVFFTMLAKFYGVRQAGRTQTPLTSLILKEGAAVFILIFALLSLRIVYEVVQRVDIQAENAVFSYV